MIAIDDWVDVVKSGVEEIYTLSTPDHDMGPLLHFSTEPGDVVIGGLSQARNKDIAAEAIVLLLEFAEAQRAAFCDSVWMREAREDNPLTDDERKALEAGTYQPEESPDRIDAVAVVVGERQEEGPRIGTLLGKVKRRDDEHALIEWEKEGVIWEDEEKRMDGRFINAIRKGLS